MSALIAAGASLLSGIFGRNAEKKAIAAQNEYNKPINIRARAEEGGFNPLLFVGPGVGLQTATGGTNYMGSALADAGLALADAMAKKAELGRLEKLTEENKKLAEKVQTLTIRPKVGGVYAQREATPSLRAALGGEDAENSAVADPAAGSGGDVVGNTGHAPASFNWLDPAVKAASDEASGVPKKDLFFWGSRLSPTSGTSDSEAFGSRYGEDFLSPGWFAGWGALGLDVFNAGAKVAKQKRGDLARAFEHDKKLFRRNSDNLKTKFGTNWYREQFPQ